MKLLEAIKAGNVELTQELIGRGADLNQSDKNGWRPLNWAAAKGRLEIVHLLLKNGADVYVAGHDQRTPAMIALAAGNADVARFLRKAESQNAGEKPGQPERKYCKAYHLAELRKFNGWLENKIEVKEKNSQQAPGNGQPKTETLAFSDQSIVFIHQDYAVTADIWHGEKVLFDQVTPAWKEFCATTLGFKVPDDLDLIVPATAKSSTTVTQ
jgi:hypothetical protein